MCVYVCIHLLQASQAGLYVERQLVEWGASVAGAYKVSPPKAHPRPPCSPLTVVLSSYSNLHVV